jgi:hypothetical protein
MVNGRNQLPFTIDHLRLTGCSVSGSRFQCVQALLYGFGAAVGINREEEGEGGERDCCGDDCPSLAFARRESSAPHVLIVFVKGVQKAFALAAAIGCLLLQIREPLLIELMKNVITHGVSLVNSNSQW